MDHIISTETTLDSSKVQRLARKKGVTLNDLSFISSHVLTFRHHQKDYECFCKLVHSVLSKSYHFNKHSKQNIEIYSGK